MTPQIQRRIEQIRHGEVPEGYKKTKVGIVPIEWKETHLKKMFSRLFRKNKEKNDNVLTISAQYGLISQRDFFNKDIASEDKSNYFLLHKGEFAYNKSYSNGYPFGALKRLDMYDKGIVSPLYICFAATKENKCPDFYVHYFEAGKMNREIQAFAQEGARNHGLLNIAVDDFFNSNIVAPSMPEQEKIAEILSEQDKLITLKDKLIEEKKRQKKALMQQLLTGNKRLPGFSGEWSTIKLSQISEKITEKNTGFKFNVVFSNSAQNGIIPQTEQFDKDIANDENIDKYYVVPKGCFVYNPRISVTAPCGPINVNHNIDTGVMSPLYTVFSVNSELIDNDYLEQYFKSTIWFRYMNSVANYGARHDRMSITDDDFFNMPIIVGGIEEQYAIKKILVAVDTEIELLQKELNQEKQKKKALMQLLLTGIVRV